MSVWCVSVPETWPVAPNWISISTLSELESCPRQWSLRRADYKNIWGKKGYPLKPHSAAIEGTIIHLAMERIIGSLVHDGCRVLNDEKAFFALKKLGGFSVVINDCITSALKPYERNPRAEPFIGAVRNKLSSRVPKFRARVQQLLSRVHLEFRNSVHIANASWVSQSREELQYGTYSEVLLQLEEYQWHGVADLVTLTPDTCEIRDFKTGSCAPQHEFQIRIYALLWFRDKAINPSGRLANKLVLSYEDSDIEVAAPNEAEIRKLEDDISKRTSAVLAEIQQSPPPAKPNQEVCSYCSVRHLCEEYWLYSIQDLTCLPKVRQYTDMQIKVTTRHGPASWDGIVESSPGIKVGEQILFHIENAPFEIQSGQTLRILNIICVITEGADDNKPIFVATSGMGTEIYYLPSNTIVK